MVWRSRAALSALLIGLSSSVCADIPRTFTFQGVLANASGVPVADGTVSITFRLYDDATAGNLLWTEPNLPVTVAGGKGAFSAVLGAPTSFGTLAFDKPYFVEVQVQGDPAMKPRLALNSVPYALRSGGASLTLPYLGTGAVPEGAYLFEVDNNAGGNAVVARAAGPSSALYGGNSGNGAGVYGNSPAWEGVHGQSVTSTGVYGGSDSWAGVWGDSNVSSGVVGRSGSWIGVYGESATSTAIWGRGLAGTGVQGTSDAAGIGVYGESASFEGVRGTSHNKDHGGVVGVNTASGGIAVYGVSDGSGATGVEGTSTGGVGVTGTGDSIGVWGNSPLALYGTATMSDTGLGVWGVGGVHGTGVHGFSDAGRGIDAYSHTGIALYGLIGNGTLILGQAVGNPNYNIFRVDASGRVFANNGYQSGGADVAEFIPASDDPQPGDVVEIDPGADGRFRRCHTAMSTRVAGVISTQPGVSMGADRPADAANTGPQLGLVGRVPVHASAENGPIRRGDLLTSSSLAGYAMRAPEDPKPGTIVGKALGTLAAGTGTVDMLVMLR